MLVMYLNMTCCVTAPPEGQTVIYRPQLLVSVGRLWCFNYISINLIDLSTHEVVFKIITNNDIS